MTSSNDPAPPLWACVAATTYQLLLLLFGVLRYKSFAYFTRSSDVSGRFPVVSNLLVVLLFTYIPLALVSITFCWVSYGEGWAMGWWFLFIPLAPLLLYLTVIVVTVNDISIKIDIERRRRQQLSFTPHL